MFDLSEKIISEALQIAEQMLIDNSEEMPIGKTGLYVIRTESDRFVAIHDISIEENAFIIAQKK